MNQYETKTQMAELSAYMYSSMPSSHSGLNQSFLCEAFGKALVRTLKK
jgi:hypothetical protein